MSQGLDLLKEKNIQIQKLQTQNSLLQKENKFLKTQLESTTQDLAQKVKPRTLREIPSLSINQEQSSSNLIIEGDNLKAMVTLYQYHNKIDLIIADPPYNTGKDFR